MNLSCKAGAVWSAPTPRVIALAGSGMTYVVAGDRSHIGRLSGYRRH